MRAIRTRTHHCIRNFDPDARGSWLPCDRPAMRTDYERWFTELWPPCPDPRLATMLDEAMRALDDPLLRGPIPHRSQTVAG